MKRQTMHCLPLCLAACLLAAGSGYLRAAEDRWFRVELLVFRHDSVSVDEAWEPTPNLAYPDAARFLAEPGRIEANLEQYGGESTLDEFGRQIITFPVEETAHGAAGAFPVDPPTSDVSPESPVGAWDDAVEPRLPGLPTPFLTLPANQREFYGKAAYMQRTGRYTTLFHQAWLQPVADRNRALALILDRSGDTGDWPLLQGSVTLYLSRYLHLETNLWLNTDGDYLPGEWRMPPPPLGPPSLIVEEAVEEPMEEPLVERWSELQEGEAGETSPDVDNEPVYPFRHAVLLQDRRRMRSEEVHYLDHPLIGLVVKLTPLTAEDLLLFSEAEGSGDYTALRP